MTDAARIPDDLSGQVMARGRKLGCDLIAVADLHPLREFVRQQGGDDLAGYRWGIAIGIVLEGRFVDPLGGGITRPVAESYLHFALFGVNKRLDKIARKLAGYLGQLGHRALAVPASLRIDNQRVCGAVSHKMVARAAGLGWIGKNCLLITPEWGPRLRWATVLTDAPLSITAVPQRDRCGGCTECVRICPPGAITGRPFREDEPREARLDVRRCEESTRLRAEEIGVICCGLCLYVCPYGRRPHTCETPLNPGRTF